MTSPTPDPHSQDPDDAPGEGGAANAAHPDDEISSSDARVAGGSPGEGVARRVGITRTPLSGPLGASRPPGLPSRGVPGVPVDQNTAERFPAHRPPADAATVVDDQAPAAERQASTSAVNVTGGWAPARVKRPVRPAAPPTTPATRSDTDTERDSDQVTHRDGSDEGGGVEIASEGERGVPTMNAFLDLLTPAHQSDEARETPALTPAANPPASREDHPIASLTPAGGADDPDAPAPAPAAAAGERFTSADLRSTARGASGHTPGQTLPRRPVARPVARPIAPLPGAATKPGDTGRQDLPQRLPPAGGVPLALTPHQPARHRPPATPTPQGMPTLDAGDVFTEADLAVVTEQPEEVVPVDAARRALTRKDLGIKITARDHALLAFLTRYRYATYTQIAGYLGTSVNALRQRLPRLKRAGLLTGDHAATTLSLVWRPTPTGVALSELDLPVPTLSWATAAHTLGLVDIGVRFESQRELVLTEREIRSADTRGRPTPRMLTAARQRGSHVPTTNAMGQSTSVDSAPRYVVTLGAGDGQFQHIPDLVLARDAKADGTPQNVAIELELNRKPPTQWRKVLRAYRDSPNIGYVVYFTHRADIRDGIARVASELKMNHMIEVRKFVPTETTIPLEII